MKRPVSAIRPVSLAMSSVSFSTRSSLLIWAWAGGILSFDCLTVQGVEWKPRLSAASLGFEQVGAGCPGGINDGAAGVAEHQCFDLDVQVWEPGRRGRLLGRRRGPGWRGGLADRGRHGAAVACLAWRLEGA